MKDPNKRHQQVNNLVLTPASEWILWLETGLKLMVSVG